MSRARPEPLIDPTTLDSFGEVQEAIAGARQQADRISEITDRGTAGEASDALKALRFAREDVEEARKAAKAPYKATGDRIDADFKELLSPLAAAERSLKDRLVAFEQAERKAAEEVRKREERNARRRQERENEKAAEEGRASHDKMGAPPPPPPPPSVRGGHGQSTVKQVTKYQVEDEAQVPDRFFDRVLNKQRLRASVMAGEAVPGVRIWKESKVATR
jgi:hypothetical protein